MIWSTCFIILGVVHITICKYCVIDNRPPYGQWEKKLHKDLSKCQKFFEAPANNTIVYVRVVLKRFFVDDNEGSMTMKSRTIISWNDKRLIWNPIDYYEIDEISFWNFEYWLPRITVIHDDGDIDEGFSYGFCSLKYNGDALCTPKLMNKVPCISFTRNWPYDTKVCNFDYGQIPYEKKNLILLPKFNRTANTLFSEYGAEWIIKGYRDYFNVTDKIKIRMTFTLERNAEGLGAVIILPPILLAILTFVTVFRDVINLKRFWMTCFSVICHFYMLLMINEKIPRAGSDIPAILIFCRFSLLLNSILVILTLGLKRLRNRTTVAPNWIGSVTNFVFDSRIKYIIWPRWKSKPNVPTLVSEKTKDIETWNNLCSIINSVLLMVCFTAYLSMIMLYVPTPPPWTFYY